MAWPTSAIVDLFGIVHPIIQAPMAGASNAVLASAVSNAGALGGYGGTDAAPEELRSVIRAIRLRTDKPFVVNLYLDRPETPAASDKDAAALRRALTPIHAELDIGDVPEPVNLFGQFRRQVDVVLEERVPVLSTHFGAPDAAVMRALKANGTPVIATATTVDEARELEQAGVDAIIAQGSEAGGHRGTFSAAASHAIIGTMVLVPQIVDAVSVPVIAAGGIMDGRGIAAALMLGAAGVQLGTAFVPCPETAMSPAYVDRLLNAGAGDAVLTANVSGRPMRLLRNRLVDLLEENSAHTLAFPEQLSLTRTLRKAALARHDAEFMTMWAGQGVSLTRAIPAADLVASLVREARDVLKRGAPVRAPSQRRTPRRASAETKRPLSKQPSRRK